MNAHCRGVELNVANIRRNMIGCDLLSSYSPDRNLLIFFAYSLFFLNPMSLYIYGLNLVVFMIVCNNFFFLTLR